MLDARRRPRAARAGRWRRSALLTPLAAVLALPLLAAPSSAAPAAPAGRVTTTYENPLRPVVPTSVAPVGGTVDSCADPTVLKGQAGEEQDGLQVWYLYCTTDPLNDRDVTTDGSDDGTAPDPVFHRIPTMTSTNLVDWTYVGDAFPLDGGDLPAWIDPSAAFWAPEVVYSRTTGRYYLFTTVTETSGAGGVGSATCRGDSAIGVAVSDSATGPWTWSDAPVVQPRTDPDGGECSYFWTYDPDVLGDTVSGTGILYYGSYYGGMFVTDVTFTPTGATARTATTADDRQIAVGNRYEGSNVVFRNGWYYLFASATNCCNGALTGYSVFVGRSRSPYGPFLDREGNSFLDLRVGGTPFLTMNGNRWIGTGHNSVFEDEGGQWWTIYHAVDQRDPFYAFQTGFTKRPALLDPVDWIGGWPTVNGGAGASDGTQPAPAAQPGQRSRHKAQAIAPQVVRKVVDADEFDGTSLSDDWSWVREATADASVGDGVLRFEVQTADLFVDDNTASVLVRDAPTGDYAVETKVRVDVPDDPPCCYNYAQAGLVVYGDDDNFVKLSSASIWETRQTEFAKEINPVPAGYSRYGNTVVGPPGEDWTWLRIVVERLSGDEQVVAGGDTERYTAYTSQDGRTWVRGGVWTHSLGTDAQIGLVSLAAPTAGLFTAEFDHVRVHALKGGTQG